MPTLRFSRDKRGYETTCVVHTPRRRNKGRSRILYWFRTPPGVRVGRAAIDEDAIRLIEEHHPDIQFDWPQILKGEEEPAPPSRPPREVPRQAPARSAPEMPPPAAAPAEPELPVEALEPLSPAHARLGSEALARLRGRYADVLANLARRVPDEQRREQMREQAERLNPDNWVTDEEVTAGLDSYESVLASLREVAGRRRRRRRGRGTPGAGSAVSPETTDAQTGADAGEGEDDTDGDEAGPDPRSGD